ncbi:hypothetical protein MAJ_08881, partial [Metarhizium majus ARSEF 297]
MGQGSSSGNPWVDVPLMVAGFGSSVLQAWDNHQTGAEMRRQMRESGPIIRTTVGAVSSYIGHRQRFERWSMFVSGLGVTAQFLDVWQGVRAQTALEKVGARIADNAEAQTGLIAPKKFAEQVHHFVSQQTTRNWPDRKRRHVFFLYHPDTDWDPAYFHRTRDQNGQSRISHRFLGMSENLDALVVWMRFMKETMSNQGTRVHIHLLVPAYRPMLIGEALTFPDCLLPLTIHGHIHNSKPYVWLNLPNPQRRLYLVDVPNLADLAPEESDGSMFGLLIGAAATLSAGFWGGPPAAAGTGASYFAHMMNNQNRSQRPFISNAEPRVLGQAPDENSDDEGSSGDDEEREARRHEASNRRIRRQRRHRELSGH